MRLSRQGTVGDAAASNHRPSSEQILLEAIQHCLPPTEAARLTSVLLKRFRTLYEIITAPVDELRQACDQNENVVRLVRILFWTAEQVLLDKIKRGPILNTKSALYDYLRVSLGGSEIELVRLLFLSSCNELIADEEHARGDVRGAMVYPRQIVLRAARLRAGAMIVVHNHPSGRLEPSDDDVLMTNKLAQALAAIDVVLHDSIIVTKEGFVSLRSRGLIIRPVWS